MADSIVLNKSNPLLPAEDYTGLRATGFDAIERLGHMLWTDYNNSDPGISILEAVCYAITDLAYRTGFAVKDILAPETLTPETWKQIFYTARQILPNNPLTIEDYRKLLIDVPGIRNAWLEPSKDYEVPVWVDYNRWDVRFDQDCQCEQPHEDECLGKLRLDPLMHGDLNICKENQATIDAITKRIDALTTHGDTLKEKYDTIAKENPNSEGPDGKPIPTKEMVEVQRRIDALTQRAVDLKAIVNKHVTPTNLDSKIVEFEGLYNVMIEYEEDVLDAGHRESVRQLAIDRLARHRNLCEDFLSVDAVEYEDFGIRASIELEETADPDQVLAEMFFELYRYFTPSVPRLTLEQMLERGYQVDEIFEGPALDHGWIDSTDLEATDLYRDIYLSDLLATIASISGVKGILYFHIVQTNAAVTDTLESARRFFAQWVERLQAERKVARIVPERSSVLMCKSREIYSYYSGRDDDRRPARMLKLFGDLKAAERSHDLTGHDTDLPIPVGENMQLQDYYPITYSLPMTYGVSERAGLPANASELRKVQALQLRGYLLFFEQMLFDYLVQLDHIRDLYTFDLTPKHTYFAAAVNQLAGLQEILMHGTHAPNQTSDQVAATFSHIVQGLVENQELFALRRNTFLDHMLARFGEDLSEYEGIVRSQWPNSDKRLIRDKSNILRDGHYYGISSGRSQGYNYASARYWDTENISGTERRAGRLLGFADVRRRSLVPTNIIVRDAAAETPTRSTAPASTPPPPKKEIVIVDSTAQGDPLLVSVPVLDGCCAESLLTDILTHASNKKFFVFRSERKQKSRATAGIVGTFWFELYNGTDPKTADLLATGKKYEKPEQRAEAFSRLEAIMAAINANEGMHLVEHILLRPKIDQVVGEDATVMPVSLLDICLDACDIAIGAGQNTDTIHYRKKITRIPAKLCYGLPPWQLEYMGFNSTTKLFDESVLFQKVPTDGTPMINLRFLRYEDLTQRVRDLQEFGSERVNYEIVSNGAEDPTKVKYGFLILGTHGVVLGQSAFRFHKKPAGNDSDSTNEIEFAIAEMMQYLSFELDLYCQADPCDNDEDPYSLRSTVVLPCWPERFRDKTFRQLVERTLRSESPAHVDIRIRWVGVLEMKRFEDVFQPWLKEMSQTELPSYEVTNPLVDVLNTLQTCGTCLDECD
ncbi:MAG: hypothetical protein JSS75_00735 [Bacteroidetes bacterium]|nr:hypothetical protein [Bacteroidota bacterium]